MDKHTTEVATQVADIVSAAGLTPWEIRKLFDRVVEHMTVGGYRPFEDNKK